MTSVELVNKIRSVKISIYLMNTYITDAINVSISLLYKCTFKMEASSIKKAIEKGH